MKKIAVLLGVAALASGAWAETESWTFKFELTNYDLHSLSDTSVYLVNTKNNTIIAYTSQADYPSWSTTTEGGVTFWQQAGTTTHSSVNSVTLDGTEYTNLKNEVWSGKLSMLNADSDKGTMTLQFLFDSSWDAANNYIYGSQEGLDNHPTSADLYNLAFILEDGTDGHGGTYVVSPVGLTDGKTVGVSQDFKNIPEPTSGLLMLFGMAGLALKRKRAA